jgi:hypothetical protein
MILENPGTSPSAIAHAHGFSAAEVAELLPIFLDNLRTDFSSADGPAPALAPPAQQPGESAEEHADRYLRELARNEHLDVVGYDTLGGDLDGDLDDLDSTDLDSTELDADLDADLDLTRGPTVLDTPEEPTSHAPAELDDQADDAGAGEPDPDLPDLAEDDPFAGPADALVPDDPGLDDLHDDAAGVDDPGEPFAMS